HGATVGQLDADALFYLRARGIGAPEARHLLVRGFASEALSGISDDALRERLLKSSLARLGEGS
ncbi:MAG: Fe-S cluster assembly protein SufD, partial [Myxococcales bacterium]|nr:Fe-S cluster assembly protein SufD [Myxococcales bacterium]